MFLYIDNYMYKVICIFIYGSYNTRLPISLNYVKTEEIKANNVFTNSLGWYGFYE